MGVGEAMLAVTIPETPGTFIDFVEAALDGASIQVTEFKYRWATVAGARPRGTAWGRPLRRARLL